MTNDIRPRERDAILQSLRSGVVPRIGLQHIQVGRKDEVRAVMGDLERIGDGSACVRFVIGRFGAGKSFFLNLCKTIALEKKFVVVQADITPDRRLHASGGQARALYSELMRSLSTKAKPEGGGLQGMVERWVSGVDQELRAKGENEESIKAEVVRRLRPLQELVNGFDFANVISRYLDGFYTSNQESIDGALRWLRAEYATRTEARDAVDVRSIIDDRNIYEYLKLMAEFSKMAGYSGFLVLLDEMGVLSDRLNSTQARNSNYEMILRIINDCTQGSASGLGFMFGGTDAFLQDKRRGLYSYEAIASRLSESTIASLPGVKDFSGPVIRLSNLAPEDLYVLLQRIRSVFFSSEGAKPSVDDVGIRAFMRRCSEVIGAEYFATPRDAVRQFVQLLHTLEQNPQTNWQGLINSGVEVPPKENAEEKGPESGDADDELSSFKLRG